jgi:hypothetical protein
MRKEKDTQSKRIQQACLALTKKKKGQSEPPFGRGIFTRLHRATFLATVASGFQGDLSQLRARSRESRRLICTKFFHRVGTEHAVALKLGFAEELILRALMGKVFVCY